MVMFYEDCCYNMKLFIQISIVLFSIHACSKSEGTFIDSRDKKEYRWVKIGEDIWMADNLAYLPSVNSVGEASLSQKMYYVLGYNGNDADEAKTFKAYSWNDSLIVPYERYGVLYNWASIISDDTLNNGLIQGICPCGWHIPTDEEWINLEKFLGVDLFELEGIGLRGNNFIGYQLKAKYGWNNKGNGIDSVGFSAFPAGEVFSGMGFLHEGERATFWTSSSGLFGSAWTRSIYCCEFGIVRIERDKMDGFSLRCVKDKN
jgi:uncharacterized protein (TIGR02145 family)